MTQPSRVEIIEGAIHYAIKQAIRYSDTCEACQASEVPTPIDCDGCLRQRVKVLRAALVALENVGGHILDLDWNHEKMRRYFQ